MAHGGVGAGVTTRETYQGGVAAALRLADGMPLERALATADPCAWLALDAGVRDVPWYGLGVPGARRYARPRIDELAGFDDPRLALALCHRDGRVREAAVHRSRHRPDLLPLVVVRCADWAAPVRERARHVLSEALDVHAAVALAALILRVGRRQRGAFGVGVLEETLRHAPRERFSALFTDPDRAVRRFAYRLAIARRLLSPVELARAAHRDDDTVVQDLCASAALATLADLWDGDVSDDVPDDVLTPLLTARNPRTRSAGVTALRASGQPHRAEAYLADRSALVRACARYVVRQHGDDPAARYRRWCADPQDPAIAPGAVIGLAECGDRADAGTLWPLVAHPAAGVRAQALAGLRALDVTDVARLRPLLDDPAPAVVRQATVSLLPCAKQLTAPWLTERTGPHRLRHVRLAAFRLLDARGGIVALRAAVGLLNDPDDKLRTWAGQSVQRWHPATNEPRGTAEVGELLDRSRHLFSDYVLERRKREAGVSG